eukprot:TRINITY_DN67672_c3_g3_i1.p1 TRINITY_DN67672_c3_g3~~TRINITY_DN67672_c3_g3_i1.p1  ORF type:complete len:528 (-),score=-16.49 TRINITY_DN67672_c3_g3_i1:578-2161(-)
MVNSDFIDTSDGKRWLLHEISCYRQLLVMAIEKGITATPVEPTWLNTSERNEAKTVSDEKHQGNAPINTSVLTSHLLQHQPTRHKNGAYLWVEYPTEAQPYCASEFTKEECDIEPTTSTIPTVVPSSLQSDQSQRSHCISISTQTDAEFSAAPSKAAAHLVCDGPSLGKAHGCLPRSHLDTPAGTHSPWAPQVEDQAPHTTAPCCATTTVTAMPERANPATPSKLVAQLGGTAHHTPCKDTKQHPPVGQLTLGGSSDLLLTVADSLAPECLRVKHPKLQAERGLVCSVAQGLHAPQLGYYWKRSDMPPVTPSWCREEQVILKYTHPPNNGLISHTYRRHTKAWCNRKQSVVTVHHHHAPSSDGPEPTEPESPVVTMGEPKNPPSNPLALEFTSVHFSGISAKQQAALHKLFTSLGWYTRDCHVDALSCFPKAPCRFPYPSLPSTKCILATLSPKRGEGRLPNSTHIQAEFYFTHHGVRSKHSVDWVAKTSERSHWLRVYDYGFPKEWVANFDRWCEPTEWGDLPPLK